MKNLLKFITLLLAAVATAPAASPAEIAVFETTVERIDITLPTVAQARIDTSAFAATDLKTAKGTLPSVYALPYSLTTNVPDWKHLWINSAIFAGAYVGTLAVLECLPEGATNWNRTTIENTPWYRRWWKNVVRKGPEWDGDDVIFNYVLHPYAGAVYFMAARSNGFNFYRSLLYSAIVSTIGWEFGIEGTMERPSIQDIFITPVVGSAVGELFYILKRHIAANDYHLFGSPVLGNIVAFLIDPVNELVGYFGHNPARHLHAVPAGLTSSLTPVALPGGFGVAFSCTF
ncbi:MAG: DUF3943 domain-containing protein [Muribaculaceae bacterium]|nr:DUF3943 domain-containing protein [Muribaculaceae bacterium]